MVIFVFRIFVANTRDLKVMLQLWCIHLARNHSLSIVNIFWCHRTQKCFIYLFLCDFKLCYFEVCRMPHTSKTPSTLKCSTISMLILDVDDTFFGFKKKKIFRILTWSHVYMKMSCNGMTSMRYQCIMYAWPWTN